METVRNNVLSSGIFDVHYVNVETSAFRTYPEDRTLARQRWHSLLPCLSIELS